MAEVDAGAVAPVANAPVANTVPAPDAPTVTDNADRPEGDEPVKPTRTYSEEEHRKAISERLSKERRRLERVARAEAEARFYKEQLETRQQQPQTPQAPKGNQEPAPEDFKDPREYVKALVRWERTQADQEDKRKQQSETGERDRREATAYLDERFTEAEEKFPDLRARLEAEDVLLTDAMLGFVLHHEHGFAVGDYLAGHSAESRRIGKLPLALQPIALKEVADKLKAAPKPTAAPAPIVPSRPAGSSRDPYDGSDTASHVKAWLGRKKKQ